MMPKISSALASRWYELQDRLWFIPTLFTIAAAILAIVMVRIDHSLISQRRPESDWLFGAGASGAREVLSAIASTMITITGLVFSITIVALQLASSQFTPRVLRTFTGDRGNQLVLGAFIATFTYALLVLRTVRDASDSGGVAFVPSASVTVALLMAGISVGFLIFFISHAANSIRASVVIDRAAQDTLALVDAQYPAETAEADSDDDQSDSVWFPTRSVDVRATKSGFLQSINERHLLPAMAKHDLTLEFTLFIGEFVMEGGVIARVSPDGAVPEHFTDRVNEALIVGSERTLQSDLELGIRQLADIAVKALSPGINDPTTATICIDRLAEILLSVARRPDQVSIRRGKDGRGTLRRLLLSWEVLVFAAFNEIRHFGASDPMVARHLSQTFARMSSIVSVEHRVALDDQRRSVIAAARRSLDDQADIARVESAR